jgi:hypothetical protein
VHTNQQMNIAWCLHQPVHFLRFSRTVPSTKSTRGGVRPPTHLLLIARLAVPDRIVAVVKITRLASNCECGFN